MSGHSKWSTIKRKKGKTDAAKSKVFTKLAKEIIVAARMGGGEIDSNFRLRTAVTAAKAASMPQDNINRAIKKGMGELEGESYEEVRYEGYGPGGTAIYVDVMTDNRNRTVGEIRHMLSKYGGNLGESGCVAWMFQKRGVITLPRAGVDEDALLESALEAGAEDVATDNPEAFEVSTQPQDVETVREALAAQGFQIETAEVTMIPQNTVDLAGKEAESMLKLMEFLEDHDDVQHVYANCDIPDELVEAL